MKKNKERTPSIREEMVRTLQNEKQNLKLNMCEIK